jgi:cephalosporin hydroxylase
MDIGVLVERYNLLKEKNADMGHYMDVLSNACTEVKAKTVIELGVRYGASTIAFLYAMYNENGELWSVDCSFPVTDPETGLDLLSSQGPLGCVDYWTFLLGYDTSPMIRQALPQGCDILFIDTNHVYEETLVELEVYLPRVRRGGRVLLHDTFIETTGNDPKPDPTLWPVRNAVEEFCVEHNFDYAFIDTYPGLGTIYV